MANQGVVEFLTSIRLESFLDKFIALGVTCVADLRYVNNQDLDQMGMKKIQKNKFDTHLANLVSTDIKVINKNEDHVHPLPSAPPLPESPKVKSPVVTITDDGSLLGLSSMASSDIAAPVVGNNYINYHIYHGLQPLRRELHALNFSEVTYAQLKQLIAEQEHLGAGITVELFAPEGYPLAPDTQNYAKNLEQWLFQNGDLILAIPCRASMLKVSSLPELNPDAGATQIFIKYNRTIIVRVDLHTDTGNTLRQKVYSKLQIPTPSIKLSYAGKPIKSDNTILVNYGIVDSSTLHMWCYGVSWNNSWSNNFSSRMCLPLVPQTEEGLSLFNSVLYVVSMHFVSATADQINIALGAIRRLTKCPPLIDALDRLFRKRALSFPQKIAIQEMLYFVFRSLVPLDLSQVPAGVNVTNDCIFELSVECWAHLISEFKVTDKDTESYTQMDLLCAISRDRLENPVCLPGSQHIYEEFGLSDAIRNEENVPGIDVKHVNTNQITPHTRCAKYLMSFTGENEAMVWNKGGRTLTELPTVPKISLTCSWAELVTKAKTYNYLVIITPLKLKSTVVQYRLTTNAQGFVIVYLERNPCGTAGSDYIFYDPMQGNECDKNPDELANTNTGTSTRNTVTEVVVINDHDANDANVEIIAPPEVITRNPEEAIIVLLDVSWSMDEEYEHGITRLQAVKQLFHAFANRSMAYNLFNVIGLTIFASEIQVHSKVTELFERFKQKVDAVITSGRTKLYDAIVDGIKQLSAFVPGYPDCRKRIICLTDGEDCLSRHSPLQVSQLALQNGVIVDSVLIGYGNKKMKSISLASGGCCFLPISLTEALKLFEMEDILSLATRNVLMHCNIDSLSSDLLRRFENLTLYKYHELPPHKNPIEMTSPVVSVRTKLTQAAAQPLLMAGGELRIKRILRELSKMQKEKHPNLEIYPNQDDAGFWRMLLSGPEFTPYQSSVFLLYVRFPLNYPASSPEIRFVTPIYHCNINSSGRICHSVFGRNYTADLEFRALMDCVFGLLCEPEPGDPLDSTMAEQYFSRRIDYNETAEKWCDIYCQKSLDEWRHELVSEEEASHSVIPPNIVCPLCYEIFLEPVITPYGNTYEKQAIEDHILQEGNDPLAYKPLAKEDLIEDTDKKREVEKYNQACNITGWWDVANN